MEEELIKYIIGIVFFLLLIGAVFFLSKGAGIL
jgi:hypothetical protein